ncbi:MAG TPA: universal stress protein [Tepidisphaeraceae bacterium]|nr:universal stress protein [Tepidisphaeraceae bacterium]
MRILITHDGSECSSAALADLPNAGFPGTATVLTFGVAEPPVGDPQVEAYLMNRRMTELRGSVTRAADRVRSMFPGWRVDTEVWPGVAGAAIAERAASFHPELIVVGSHDRGRFGRLLLGSVSQSVLHHANCSVRVARRPLQRYEEGLRLLIGLDGSHDADAVVRAVAARYWPVSAEVRVVGVVDAGVPLAVAEPALSAVGDGATLSSISAYYEEHSDPLEAMAESLKTAAAALRAAGVRAAPQVLEGDPAETLLYEAEQWGADCIFVGARGLGRLERLLLGSVSSTVATGARCSVEVVRT